MFRLVDVKETYENNFIESLFQVVNEVISFRMFVLIMFCFSEHIDNEQKSVIYFQLFDFDNDKKISKNDIETYLCNLSKSPEELIDIPLREYNNDTVDTNKDNNISQMELPNTIKEQKQERQQSDADLLTLVENKRIKEDEQKDTVINVNNNTKDVVAAINNVNSSANSTKTKVYSGDKFKMNIIIQKMTIFRGLQFFLLLRL